MIKLKLQKFIYNFLRGHDLPICSRKYKTIIKKPLYVYNIFFFSVSSQVLRYFIACIVCTLVKSHLTIIIMYLSQIIITNLAYSINTRNIKFDITLVKHQSLKPRITNVWIYSDKETKEKSLETVKPPMHLQIASLDF